MDEKGRLLDALRRSPETEWRTAALISLDDPTVVFAGSPDPAATSMAGDLWRIYGIRLDHCRERGIDARGIYELVESLGELAHNAKIEVRPFLGPQSSVIAFWDVSGVLLGVITVVGLDPERARDNLDIALGK